MISIIIPVCNEETHLKSLLPFLHSNGNDLVSEIIVVCGGSTDDTKAVCEGFGVKYISTTTASRSIQMNMGAAAACGQLLYFVHADTCPPPSFAFTIVEAYNKTAKAGRFKTIFDSKSILLKMNAYFTKFDWFMCYGGDQTLYVEAALFKKIGGFNEAMHIMEDYEITERLKGHTAYSILNGFVKVSARKYEKNSWWAVQRANYRAVNAYKKNIESATIKAEYLARIKR